MPPTGTLGAPCAQSQSPAPVVPARGSPCCAGAWEHVRMANDDLLTDGEEAVEVLHPHWKVLVRPVAVAVVVLAGLLALEVIIPSGSAADLERLVVLAIAVVFLMWWLMVPLLRWRTTTYELTT